jgi:hypothetical protein
VKPVYFGLAVAVLSAVISAPARAVGAQRPGAGAGIKGWSSGGGKYVVLRIPKQNRTYYFVNDESRLCFSFWVRGTWHPTGEAGLLEADDAREYAGALVLSAADLKKYEGKDLLARAVSLHMHEFTQRRGKAPKSSNVEAFESPFPGSIRWSAQWYFQHDGHKYLAEVVRFMAKVKPEWVVVVTASFGTDRAGTARRILKSFTTTTEPGCYRREILNLTGSN